MLTIDSQVHAYERNHPGRPWRGVLTGPSEVGVYGAVLMSAFTVYRFDASYTIEVHKKHRGRFALVKPVDPTDTPGTVAVRILLARGRTSENPADPGINRVLATAGMLSLPVNMACSGRLHQALEFVRRNPDTQPAYPARAAYSRISRHRNTPEPPSAGPRAHGESRLICGLVIYARCVSTSRRPSLPTNLARQPEIEWSRSAAELQVLARHVAGAGPLRVASRADACSRAPRE
jgi:hypothetical protein